MGDLDNSLSIVGGPATTYVSIRTRVVCRTTMGNLIQFPKHKTRNSVGNDFPDYGEAQGTNIAASYQRDLDRAVALLLEHVQSGAYDGIALVLKSASPTQESAFVVGGSFRHRLTDAAAATLQLHLAISLRANRQSSEARAGGVTRTIASGALSET